MTDSSEDYVGEGIAPVQSDVVDEGVLDKNKDDDGEMQDADVLPAFGAQEFGDPNDPLAIRRENIVDSEHSTRAKDFEDVFAKDYELDKTVEDVLQANVGRSAMG